MSIFSGDELAYSTDENGNMHAAGFKLNTIFNNTTKPISSISQMGGGSSSNNTLLDRLSNDIAVPAGLFYLNSITPQKNIISTNDEVASTQLIDRLVDLMSPLDNKNPKTTRKKMAKLLSSEKKTTIKLSSNEKHNNKKMKTKKYNNKKNNQTRKKKN